MAASRPLRPPTQAISGTPRQLKKIVNGFSAESISCSDPVPFKGLSEAWLAGQLRPYGIGPRTVRIGEGVAKGYLLEDFLEAFRRYVPRSEVEALKADIVARTVNSSQSAVNGPQPD